MDAAMLLLLGGAVFGAAGLQSATGIGYGVIAGPIFLTALDGSQAFEISTLHNFAIALLLLPSLRRQANLPTLRWLVLGSIPGIAAGLMLQALASVLVLKLLAAAVIAFVMLPLIADVIRAKPRLERTPALKPGETLGIGVVAGLMGGMLAMPGPVAATWLAIKGYPKSEIRATILTFFIFAYAANAVFFYLSGGFAPETTRLATIFLAPLVLGVGAGAYLSKVISERAFRWILLLVLVATLVVLISDVVTI